MSRSSVCFRSRKDISFNGLIFYITPCGRAVPRTHPDTCECQAWATTYNRNKVTCPKCKEAEKEPKK